MFVMFKNDWAPLLNEEFEKEYFIKLQSFLDEEYKTTTVYPHVHDIYNAFYFTPFQEVKVVILGQDPYHGLGQAHGLCFSVQKGVQPPPSLMNIFKELKQDLNLDIPSYGSLEAWARQGVFLLNTTLTVRAGQPMSHQGRGWEIFTDRVISLLGQSERPTVFILWGSHAQKKKTMIDGKRHLVLCSPHPSPLSSYRGFFGSAPFSKANAFLVSNGMEPVDWSLTI